MRPDLLFSPPARGVIVAGALALVIGLMKFAAPVVAPLLLAVFIAIIATPALHWMRRVGMPKWSALLIITFVLLDIGSLIALVTTGALEGFRDSLPTYQERFVLLSEQFGSWLEGIGVSGSREAIPDLLNPAQAAAVVPLLLANASGIFATGLLVLLAVVFILLEAPALPAKLRTAFKLSPEGESRLQELLGKIKRYMLIKTMTSLGTAFCVWLLLRLFGVDFAILWAVLAFFLNFVPVVGNILMTVPPTLMALVQSGPQSAVLVAAGILMINVVIGNVLEPRVMGRGLGISTLAIFIALLVWGWLFGTVGMFLAVPLTTALIMALDASPHTRPIAILLGPDISDPQTGPDGGKALGGGEGLGQRVRREGEALGSRARLAWVRLEQRTRLRAEAGSGTAGWWVRLAYPPHAGWSQLYGLIRAWARGAGDQVALWWRELYRRSERGSSPSGRESRTPSNPWDEREAPRPDPPRGSAPPLGGDSAPAPGER